ncbi:UNVERIFIED_CONTAM: hypothetical protein Slati_4549000 [Sesamum latifolium]|uniref:Uncharacterized protein n=1 Tax=Sesamum latifolium TaxID=2727402 RepID=A0AAW2RNW8_9LAMI
MSTSDESVHFVGESNPGDDPSEATSRRAGSRSAGPSSGRRRSLSSFDRRGGGRGGGEASSPEEEEGVVRALTPVSSSSAVDLGPSILQRAHIEQMREDFFLLSSLVIDVPGPQARVPFPPPNWLAFFRAQLLAGLHFSIPPFYQEIACLFRVPLNQLVPNSFRILASFYIIFHFNEQSVSAQIFSQYFCLKSASRGFFLLTPRPGVSFLPAPSAPKKWKNGFFFVLSSWPWGFSDQWIEETPPPLSVGERDAPLTSFLNMLNEHPYDCLALIDERLLGHFDLSPHVEPLDEPLADIMFSKYFRELSDRERERGGNTPVSRSAKGTPPPAVPKEAEASSLAASLMRGIMTPEDRRLLAPLGREDLERKVALHLLKGLAACETLFPVSRGASRRGDGGPESGGEGKALGEGEHPTEGGEEGGGYPANPNGERAETPQQDERIMRRPFARPWRRRWPTTLTEEGKNFLEAFWASKWDEYKKSEDFQKEVAQIAYANAPDPFAKTSASEKEDSPQDSEDDLDSLLGEVEAEVRQHPLQQQLILQRGVPLVKGRQRRRKRRLLLVLQKAPPMTLLLQPSCQRMLSSSCSLRPSGP